MVINQFQTHQIQTLHLKTLENAHLPALKSLYPLAPAIRGGGCSLLGGGTLTGGNCGGGWLRNAGCGPCCSSPPGVSAFTLTDRKYAIHY
ncbi:unnamed protein product [Acanthoscelides obtectus]|uniref:Uncharacterized protein n=1 Tax=Acanthoscelides obtectus TaxID=200917 RepID=A0A9P0JV20_ACAOB|nr:unnamed protein product [Acanthoscelides obtectus]CAK1666133.1 hypothetical protein AOBTE_LOCUS25170 [Acanthoscelides obtectus]